MQRRVTVVGTDSEHSIDELQEVEYFEVSETTTVETSTTVDVGETVSWNTTRILYTDLYEETTKALESSTAISTVQDQNNILIDATNEDVTVSTTDIGIVDSTTSSSATTSKIEVSTVPVVYDEYADLGEFDFTNQIYEDEVTEGPKISLSTEVKVQTSTPEFISASAGLGFFCLVLSIKHCLKCLF